MNEFKAFPKPVALIIFFVGLTSALCFRVIIIVQHFNPSYVRVFWYIAVITNLLFFLVRYYISLKRKKAVQSTSLIKKLNEGTPLNDHEKAALTYLLTSIERSRENLNYLSIFALSIIAIIVDLIMSF